jgi:hypothetical protein
MQICNTICVGHYSTLTDTNNVNKTWAILRTTGGKDEPNTHTIEELIWKQKNELHERLTVEYLLSWIDAIFSIQYSIEMNMKLLF